MSLVKTMRNKSGFTLIEMLVVIVVIGILSGLVFKLFSMSKAKAETADAIMEMEAISDALAEFYAEYGQYPPVSRMKYEYENSTLQHPVFCNTFLPQNLDWGGTLFRFDGLVSWLWPRIPQGGADWPNMPGSSIQHKEEGREQWIGDTPRDFAAKRRWARFLVDIELYKDRQPYTNNWVASGEDIILWPYTNDYLTVIDPWGSEYIYDSPPPHMTYELWSAGPDKTANTEDDIMREGWD